MPTLDTPPKRDPDGGEPDWSFDLPDELIARYPAPERALSRLMRLPLEGGPPVHHTFRDLPDLLREGDLLVANNSRVMAARLFASRPGGGRTELLVLSPGDPDDPDAPVDVIVRPARKLKAGMVLALEGGRRATVREPPVDGIARISFEGSVRAAMEDGGAMPLPPYLGREADSSDRERYQTIFAGPLGSCAAPTAGLHFDDAVLAALAAKGIALRTVTLHVGIGTFRPPRPEDLERGELHSEPYEVPEQTASAVAETRARGGRVIAVGTTSARTLESAAAPDGTLRAGAGETRLFIRPPYRFRAIDGLLTNFHLPNSSLLMLVGALIGRERALSAYAEAVRDRYRFYSYGDAMLLA